MCGFYQHTSGVNSMKSKRSIIHYSLFVALLGSIAIPANGAMRVGNHSRSYAAAYQQVNAMRNPAPAVVAQQTAANAVQPVNDASTINQNIGVQTSGVSANDAMMTQCSMIYPNGEFLWDSPTIGSGVGGAETCVAVVELRGYQAGPDGSDVVLARANLAAGDTVTCNISSFPDATMNESAVSEFVFPADAAPTMDDVIQQMNREQKQNAGFKIAAGAIIGGLGGNMAGENDVGNDALLGTDKGKVQGTVIGALSGAALAAGSTYAGKVAGDTILSAGVNAAAGGVMGNMASTGESVLRIEKCTLPSSSDGTGTRDTTCLWGALITANPLGTDSTAFYNIETGATYVCDANMGNCKNVDLVSVVLTAFKDKDVSDLDSATIQNAVLQDSSLQYYISSADNSEIKMVAASGSDSASGDGTRGVFTKIQSAGTIDRQIAAMVEMKDGAFGKTRDDWNKWRRSNTHVTIYGRTGTGTGYVLSDDMNANIKNFYPMYLDAESGSLIDLNNKARLKSTLVGAGVGGALGGFAGYQGAQTDVQNRWVTAVREYEDSLSKVYCATGNRYLSAYNDTVFIPAMTTTTDTVTE